MKALQSALSRILAATVSTLLILCLSFVAVTQVASASPILTVNFDQDRAGGDFDHERVMALEECLEICGDDLDCKAYTYNPQGIGGDGEPVCWLKEKVNPLRPVPPYVGAATGVVLRR
ncbi:MAG: PAN domain-containing protein [Cyanobacteria bacterium SBLK]|nr:PAN domain-containing protein [Cyanobacteria bacterium SBLK]